MSHYDNQRESFVTKPNHICGTCNNPDKPSISKINGKDWICDDCAADQELKEKQEY